MTKEIIEEIKKTREIILDKAIFGRKIIIKIAFSPSNSALRGIARSKQYKEAKGLHSKTVSDFRVDYYRGLL